MNRINRAPGDSAQNEAERTNASIGEALVDGTASKWENFKPFDGLTSEEIDELSPNELKEKEDLCMEKNAWRLARDVAAMIDDEPGLTGNFIKCYVTRQEKSQFFFNQPYLMKYAPAKTEAKKIEVPGCNYFKKIYAFTDSQCLHNAMFLEYLKGSCKDAHGKLCDFCTSREKCCSQIEHVRRPFPDHEYGYHYLPADKTPTNNRVVDDCLPRTQLKKAYFHSFESLLYLMQPACRFLILDGEVFEDVLILQKSSYINIRNKKIIFLKKCSYIQPWL